MRGWVLGPRNHQTERAFVMLAGPLIVSQCGNGNPNGEFDPARTGENIALVETLPKGLCMGTFSTFALLLDLAANRRRRSTARSRWCFGPAHIS